MRISDVVCHPLTTRIAPDELNTSWGVTATVSIIVVEVRTDEGLVGYGEGLARYAPAAYKALIDDQIRGRLLGEDPFDAQKLWQRMFRVFSGKSGGMLIESLSAVDIALWDLMGKATGLPVYKLLGGMGRTHVPAYASSISWSSDEVAIAQTRRAVAQGFRSVKVKIGAPLERAIARCRLVRETAPAQVRLAADANWVFDFDEAVTLGRALAELDYEWLEEPIIPEDLDGYKRLRAALPIRLAAGESEHTAVGARELIVSRAVGLIQPDVARSGGITETRNIAMLAHAFQVPYAPHVGQSGAICVAASLHLAAAMPNLRTFECMIFANPLREALARNGVPGGDALIDGELPVPQGPGLGIEPDFDVLDRYRVA